MYQVYSWTVHEKMANKTAQHQQTRMGPCLSLKKLRENSLLGPRIKACEEFVG